MINSLRPFLADCPAVLQQKWHWNHLSMLPDNAHKCEICQTQYVNNHNCTGWGHVQANPTEMLLDDVRGAGFSCDFVQMIPQRKSRRSWRTVCCASPTSSLRSFSGNDCKCINSKYWWRFVGPKEGKAKRKPRFKVKLKPLIYTQISNKTFER